MAAAARVARSALVGAYHAGVDFVFGPGQGILGGNVAQLTFRAIAPVCAANNLVWIASSGFNTCISSEAPANGAAVADVAVEEVSTDLS